MGVEAVFEVSNRLGNEKVYGDYMSTDFSVIRTFSYPTLIRFGAGAVRELPGWLKAQGLSNPLLVTDPQVEQLDFFKAIREDLESKGISVEVFSGIHKNPVKSDVLRGGDLFAETKRDSIIGLGGGAAMDVARAIALRINHRRDLFEYDDLIGGDQYVTGEVPPFVTIPTTSGTGSEVGRSAIISDDVTHQKKILFSPQADGEDRVCGSYAYHGTSGFHHCRHGHGRAHAQYGSLCRQKLSSAQRGHRAGRDVIDFGITGEGC